MSAGLHCPRLDAHEPHEYLATGWPTPGSALVYECAGVLTIEGGALVEHECGARVLAFEIRECCGRCTGTLCPECAPCRRVS